MDKGKPTSETENQDIPAKPEYSFPPANQHPLVVPNRLTGDLWLGINPLRMGRRSAIAWATFQLESAYDNIEAQIEAQRQALAKQGNGKKSIRDILTGPFRS